MWQLVFVAAVAGSSILVKHLFRNGEKRDHHHHHHHHHHHPVRVSSVSELKEEEEEEDQTSKTKVEEKLMEVQREEEEEEEEESFDIVKPKEALITSLGVVSSSCIGDSWMSDKQLHPVVVVVKDEGSSSIFRFTSSSSSSLDPGGEGRRSSSSSSSSSSSRGEKKLMMLLEEEEEDQRNKRIRKRRNVSFCLKRRRTGKIAFRKSGSCKEESKGNSLFSCGVGFGFLLSAGKAELNKLTADNLEETAQIITSCKDGVNMETMGMKKTDLIAKLATPNDPEVLDMSSNGDGECPSSILTEEVEMDRLEAELDLEALEMDRLEAELDLEALEMDRLEAELDLEALEMDRLEAKLDLEALEMDRLEAELESELQKIPDEDDPEYFMDFPSTELSADALEECPQEPLGMDQTSSQFYGVLPTELDRKLCHVLIKQQERQIAELESNLYLSQMKLREKDAELRKLKAVVCSLRDFSLQTASDDEAEDCVILDEVEEEEEKEMKSNADSLIYPISDDKIIVVKEQKSLCGVKRLMEFESYAIANCQVNHNALVS